MAQLKKELSYPVLLLLAINSMLGTGILFLPGFAAFIAGPASLLAWIGAAIIAIFIAMCFAELSSMMPKSGGVYEYTKQAFGSFAGFMTGWMTWIVANVSIAMFVSGGFIYLGAIFNISEVWTVLLSIIFILGITYVSYRGIGASAKLLVAFAVITLSSIIFVILVGAPHIDVSRLSPLIVFPPLSILVALYFIFEVFFGWEAITFFAEETKDPKRVLPKTMIMSTLILAGLVISVVFVSLTAIDWTILASSDYSAIEVVSAFVPPWLLGIFTVFLVFNILGSAADGIISTPRLVFAMARDNHLPKVLSKVHPRYSTPHYAIILQTVIILFVFLLGSFRLLLEVLLPLTVISYSLVILSVTQLRKKMPNAERPFKMPFGMIIPPLLVSLLWIIMFMGMSFQSVALGLSLVLLGIPLYWIAILGYHKKFIRFFSNLSGDISFHTYNFFIGNYVLNHLYNYFSDATIEKVADIGCGVGVATHQMAKRIPLDGMIYGVDFAKRELDIARQHQKERDIKNLEFIQADLYNLGENKETDRKLRGLDGVMGIGVLGYLQDPVVVLSSMKKRLRAGGKFYFVDYDYATQLFDKPWLESNEKIRDIFAAAGLKVKIWRQKRLFWQYVHMYGEKE
ncbi:MAG: amino acid permease [Candidatus Nanoarchaeia archaeon]|nr:amino acid permease [Candidatus Nanoarchaeia archaeon]MDD5239766.1 amino acid permease [Candidatus Nanoarchaeia archaeon]